MKYGKNPPHPGEHPPRPHAHRSLTNITGGEYGEKTTGALDVGVPTPTHLQPYGPVIGVCGTLVETVPTHPEFMAVAIPRLPVHATHGGDVGSVLAAQ
jgi:hypothetical protein